MCFSRKKTVVRPRRPAEAAYYSKWLWVTVVSVWLGIRNTDGLKIDTGGGREGGVDEYTWKTNIVLPSSSPTPLASGFYAEGFELQVYF